MDRLILVGGGHAHLYVIQNLKRAIKAQIEVVLISADEKQYYSGMASGVLEGYYTASDMCIDLPRFCQHYNVRFIHATVCAVDFVADQIIYNRHEILTYKYLSFNTGSEMHSEQLTSGFMIKPLSNIQTIIDHMKLITEQVTSNSKLRISVVGTGAAGIEMGLAAKNRLEKSNVEVDVTFINARDDLLKGFPQNASSRLAHILERQPNIIIMRHEKAVGIEQHLLNLTSGRQIESDVVLIATGIKGSAFYKNSGFKTDAQGFMVVHPTMQSIDASNVFGAGDCVSVLTESVVPKNGVYAIKQAKVLLINIENKILNQDLVSYKPQNKYLAIIALKKGQAQLIYGNFTWIGKTPFLLKQWIDLRYMKKLKRGI